MKSMNTSTVPHAAPPAAREAMGSKCGTLPRRSGRANRHARAARGHEVVERNGTRASTVCCRAMSGADSVAVAPDPALGPTSKGVQMMKGFMRRG